MLFMICSIASYAQEKLKDNIKIIEVVKLDKASMVNGWKLTYVDMKSEIYSGAFFDDYGDKTFSFDDKYVDLLYNDLFFLWPSNKKVYKNKFKKMNTGCKEIDEKFYWRCFEVPVEYSIIPVNLNKDDFFDFFYKKNKAVIGFSYIDFNKIKIIKELPPSFSAQIINNMDCSSSIKSTSSHRK